MIRKLILTLIAALLVLSACVPASTSVEEPITQTSENEDDIDEPTANPDVFNEVEEGTTLPLTPYPDSNKEELDVDPTPCSEPENPSQPIENDPDLCPEYIEWPLIITDDLGNTIELSSYPDSIVSISPSTTEILFAIGAGEQIVGRDDFSLYPEAAMDVESIGSLWEGVPTEAILALEPDLVIAAQIVSEENIQVLLDLGLPVYWQANPTDFDGLYANLLKIAEIAGHTEAAEALVIDLQTRVHAVETSIAAAKDAPTVFYELDATDPANPWTTGSGTFIDYIITLAGGLNAAVALQGDYAQISAEQLIAVNPEIILLADALYGVTPESVAVRPGWDVINAVQNDAIFPIDPNMMSVPGPRLVDALEETAQIIHPELFE